MKMLKKALKTLPLLAAIVLLAVFLPRETQASSDVEISAENFPEAALREAVSMWDYNSDGYLDEYEIMDVTYMYLDEAGITTLKGIELLPNLQYLSAYSNKLKSIDVTQNTELKTLDLRENSLTSIDVTKNALLEELYLCDNKLSSIDLSDKYQLQVLDVQNNKLKSLTLYSAPTLSYLCCSENQIKELDLIYQQYLENLTCYENQLTSLNLSSNPELVHLDCAGNNISSLNISVCKELETLDVSNNPLTELNVADLGNLKELWAFLCELSVLNVTQNPKLGMLDVRFNKITSLNISCCPTLCHAYENGEKEVEDDAYVCTVGDVENWEAGYYLFAADSKVKVKTTSASLNAPDFSAVNLTGQISLKWNKVSGADSYEIWRMKEGQTFEKLKTSTGTVYNDKGAKSGVTYYYEVRAMAGTKSGPFSKVLKVTRNPYTDVSESNSFFGAVMWVTRNGIASGTGASAFSPDASCTRYQFAVMLYKYAGRETYSLDSLPFTDVPKTASYYDAVCWAYENGIISGTSKTKFSPNAEITRYQVVQMLYKYSGRPDVETTVNPFKDVSKKASYYNAVLWAVENGITAGTSKTTFSPDAPCKRYQMAVFLRKFDRNVMFMWYY